MVMMKYNPYYKPALAAIPYMLARKPSAVARGTQVARRFATGRKPVRQRSLKSAIKQLEPARHFSFETNQLLLHNTMVTCVPTQGPVQGNSNINRTGDALYLCALKFQGFYLSSAPANFYSLRLLVGWTGEEVTSAGASSSFVSGLGLSEVFLPGTATLGTVNGIVNPKAFTCLYDITIDSNSQIVATNDGNSFKFTVPLNQSYDYQSSSSVQGKLKNLVVVAIGNVSGGVTGTTAAGNIICSMDLIFKD